MAETVETLKCGRGHEVEVHHESGQKGEHWQCPECVADPDVNDDETLVAFGGKR